MSSLMCNSKFSMGGMIISRVLIITCEMFLKTHLSNTSSISLIGGGRGRVGGLGGAL